MSMHFHLLITPSLTRLLCPGRVVRHHLLVATCVVRVPHPPPPAVAASTGTLPWSSVPVPRRRHRLPWKRPGKGGMMPECSPVFFFDFWCFFFPLSGLKKPIETSAVMSSTPKTRYRSWPGAHPGLRQCRAVAAQHRLDGGGKGPALSDVACESIGPTSCYLSWIFPSGMMIRN